MGKLSMELKKIIPIIIYGVSIAILIGMFIKLIEITYEWYWMY
jgi:hypothetical protein